MTMSAERQDFLSAIIITAVEGGINYWAAVEDYSHTTPAQALVYDQEEGIGMVLNVPAVDIALEKILTGADHGDFVKYFPKRYVEPLRIANLINDTCPDDIDGAEDIDADFADAIVQVALFGEVIYG